MFLYRPLKGIYSFLIPVKYDGNGRISDFSPVDNQFPRRITKRFIKDLDQAYYPGKVIVPYTGIVHDRIMLELFRGCTRGCRFCQAGMIYRPVREKTPETLRNLARKLVESTGYEEISLASLSTSDYTQLIPLVEQLIKEYKDKRVGLSLPSLRIDSFSVKLAEEIQKIRKTGLTFAPEAGTQRLRDVINKGVTRRTCEFHQTSLPVRLGTIKLYFMIGLPTETYRDVEAIAELGKTVIDQYYQVEPERRNKKIRVTISTSSFVPKPLHPFSGKLRTQ